MRKFKRALAMNLVLALLLSFSPALGVTAAEADTSAYNQLMHDYKLNNSASAITIADAAQKAGYITEGENGSVKFGNFTEYGEGGFYVDVKHGLTNATKFVFEAEFCCNAPGFLLYMRANKNSSSKYPDVMKLDGNKLSFMGTNGATVTLGEGERYKVTVAFDLDNKKYDAFVNDEQVVDDGVTTNAIASLTRLRVQIDSKTVAGGEFLIRDIKWYTPDETGACPDENKDHICDYGCSEPVGECGDADGDELCDYGCGKVYSPYNDLMHDYKLNNTSSSVSYSSAAGKYITEDENGYVKFDEFDSYVQSCYVDMKHGLTGATKLVFEAEFCCNAPGFVINIRANNYNSKTVDLIKVSGNELTFMGNKSKMVTLDAGEWYKITLACDLDTHTYDAFVNEKRIIDDGATANQLTTLSRVRAQINDTTVAGGEFLIRDIKWYTPDETGACTDANKDHVCDYDSGCGTVGICEDADGDGLCDYGCGKETHHVYKVEDGKIVDENGNEVAEIKASGTLDMNGQDAAIKVTGENTKLAVVDTSWMTNGLSGEKAAKLTVDPDSTGTIESYTQYGDFKYLKVPGEDGAYTFHPFNLTVTRMGLNTVKEAISLEVQFVADNVVRDLLIANGHSYGLKNITKGVEESVKDNSAYQFTEQKNRAVAYFATQNSLHNDNFDTEGRFQAYMKLKVGNEEVEILSNYIAEISPRQIMTDLNNSSVQPSSDQLVRIREMLTKPEYSELANVLTRFKEA